MTMNEAAKTIDPSRIRALALDMDGTTIRPDSTLSGQVKKALDACAGRGIELIICTGRSTGAAEPYRLAIGAEGPMVYYNGAEVVDMPSGKVLESTFLDLETVDFCIDLSRKSGVYFHLFLPATDASPKERLVADAHTAETEIYKERTGLDAETGDLKRFIAESGVSGCIKGMFIASSEVLDKIKPVLEERLGNKVYLARSYHSFLEIMAAGVSKGEGLTQALRHRGIDPSQTIAFGDEENDLPMFGAAAFSVAPESAKEQVKSAADFIMPSNAEDGLAVFLEDLFGLERGGL
ncbi:Cof-type HAD-IIB family hydrolase [Treponema sp. OttesenSCG-928-L16]|nr:Cof-type HAD-IIB family hydrolase [Treponema sp. OttesenSCG-928-L16]